MAHDWPGNVRALQNAIEWVVVLAAGPVLSLPDFPAEIRVVAPARESPARPEGAGDAVPAADGPGTGRPLQSEQPELKWVIGSGWALSRVDERGPTPAELDAVVTDRPAVFYGRDGQSFSRTAG